MNHSLVKNTRIKSKSKLNEDIFFHGFEESNNNSFPMIIEEKRPGSYLRDLDSVMNSEIIFDQCSGRNNILSQTSNQYHIPQFSLCNYFGNSSENKSINQPRKKIVTPWKRALKQLNNQLTKIISNKLLISRPSTSRNKTIYINSFSREANKTTNFSKYEYKQRYNKKKEETEGLEKDLPKFLKIKTICFYSRRSKTTSFNRSNFQNYCQTKTNKDSPFYLSVIKRKNKNVVMTKRLIDNFYSKWKL